MIVTVYGEGGLCEPCSAEHPHQWRNIIEEYTEPDPPQDAARNALITKLMGLGLTQDEINAFLGAS